MDKDEILLSNPGPKLDPKLKPIIFDCAVDNTNSWTHQLP